MTEALQTEKQASQMSILPAQPAPLAWTTAEAANRARCSEFSIRKAIRNGELKATLLGNKFIILEDGLIAWLLSKQL